MVFGPYAEYYDLFYRSKDYRRECDFLEKIFKQYGPRAVRTVLDLGCGTAGHALALCRRGYVLSGVDASARMLKVARRKMQEAGFCADLTRAKLQDFSIGRRFDAAICMFSVIDYLTRDEDLACMLANTARHLNKGGLFICDFWHAPAVKGLAPRKTKTFKDGDISVERSSRTALIKGTRTCAVRYTCRVRKGRRVVRKIAETHCMRYFDVEEMAELLGRHGFKVLAAGPFLNINGKVRANTWDVAIVARWE